jgi:hypothetical protein
MNPVSPGDTTLPVAGIYGRVAKLFKRPTESCVNLKRSKALSVLVVFVLVTGMAPLCLCRCCESVIAAEPVAASDSGVEDASKTCCDRSQKIATGKQDSNGHGDAAQEGVSACSCDVTSPTRFEAITADASPVVCKIVVGQLESVRDTHRPTLSEPRFIAFAAAPHSHNSAFLTNCSFLC